MSDIVQRLRDRAYAGKGVDTLCEEAAGEIERLRHEPCPYVTGTVTHYCSLTPFTLADAEREAVEWAMQGGTPAPDDIEEKMVATLRGLLERTK